MTDRTSRQDLVVSPPTSRLPFALTAGGSACVGFALVWGMLAAGQVFKVGPAERETMAVEVELPDDVDPSMPESDASGLQSPGPVDPFHPPGSSPASHGTGFASETPGVLLGETIAAGIEPRETRFGETPGGSFRRSRFGDDDASAGVDVEPDGGSVTVVSAVEEAVESAHHAAPEDSLAGTNSIDPGAAMPQGPAAESIAVESAPIPLPEDRGDLAALDAAPALPPLEQVRETSAGVPSETEPSPAPLVAPTVIPPVAEHVAAAAIDPPQPPPAAGARPAAWNTGGGNTLDDPGAPVPAAALPRTAADPSPVASAMPFAAAPPLVNRAIVPDERHSPGAGLPTAPVAPSGQGRPGPIHLEGVQTPQLAVEKRGPREIQVGKTARFEIIVRNVGSAQANDIVLRDSVPFGTTLVATTPPAAPAPAGGDPGELVWLLGALPPGGQVRVGVDLMPISEGDVGSVASVSFRADASVRTRATRPALEITAQSPAPVLVGGDSRLTITISNPGSGVATGVILESILPDGLAHRAGRELEFDVGTLPPGEARSIDLVLATTGPGTHGLRLSARADGQIEVTDTVKVAVTAPTLDLAVAMPSRRYLQRPATCTISMTNAGTAPAVGVELVAQLPPGLKFVRANNSGYYEERTHRVLWNLEELPAAETGEVEVVLMPVALGPQKIVTAARTPAGLSDQIAHTVEVEGLAALAFEVADSEDPIEVGGVSEYVIRVANQGTKPASGVRVVATLLGDLEAVEARGPAPHRVDNLTVSFEPLAKLAPSEEALYRIRVRGRREGDQRVQVQLTSDEQPAPLTKEETTRVYADR